MSESLEIAWPYIGKVVQIIDRPIGSKHPKYEFEYTDYYCFILDTRAPDSEEQDANFSESINHWNHYLGHVLPSSIDKTMTMIRTTERKRVLRSGNY